MAFFFDAEPYADLEFLEGGPISTLRYCLLLLKGHAVCEINTSFKIYLMFKYTLEKTEGAIKNGQSRDVC